MRGVLDHAKTVVVGQGAEGERVGRASGVVDRQDDAGPRRDGLTRRGDVHRRRVPVHVDEDRCRAGVEHRVGGGAERQRRRDHFVARAHLAGEQGEMETGRAGVERHGLARADVPGERGLERLHARTGGEPARAEHLGHRRQLGVAHVGAREGHEGGTGLTAGDGGHAVGLGTAPSSLRRVHERCDPDPSGGQPGLPCLQGRGQVVLEGVGDGHPVFRTRGGLEGLGHAVHGGHIVVQPVGRCQARLSSPDVGGLNEGGQQGQVLGQPPDGRPMLGGAGAAQPVGHTAGLASEFREKAHRVLQGKRCHDAGRRRVEVDGIDVGETPGQDVGVTKCRFADTIDADCRHYAPRLTQHGFHHGEQRIDGNRRRDTGD